MTGPSSPGTSPVPDPGDAATWLQVPGLSRRRALQLGGLGLLGAAVGGPAWARAQTAASAAVLAEVLREPETLRSENGLLQVRLEVTEAAVTLGGRYAHVLAYNGTVPGPTLRLHPGDRRPAVGVDFLRILGRTESSR